jgi:hypothetical protein
MIPYFCTTIPPHATIFLYNHPSSCFHISVQPSLLRLPYFYSHPSSCFHISEQTFLLLLPYFSTDIHPPASLFLYSHPYSCFHISVQTSLLLPYLCTDNPPPYLYNHPSSCFHIFVHTSLPTYNPSAKEVKEDCKYFCIRRIRALNTDQNLKLK